MCSYFGTDPGDLTADEMYGREPVPARCELQGCKSKGVAKNAVGLFQVYAENTPTMNRPAFLCQACVDFAKQCGMTPRVQPNPSVKKPNV